jgi:hypothetical protein
VTIDFFEGLVHQLQVLFEKYKLLNEIICYVKDERTNLYTLTNVFRSVVSYEDLGIHITNTIKG